MNSPPTVAVLPLDGAPLMAGVSAPPFGLDGASRHLWLIGGPTN